MTTEEKLTRFRSLCIEEEEKRSQRVIEEYKRSLEEGFEEHKKDALRRQKDEISAGRDKADREIRKKLAKSYQRIRRAVSEKNLELKESLFRDVEEKLLDFRKTDGYKKFIRERLEEIKRSAEGEKCEIYYDVTDSAEIKKIIEDGAFEGASVKPSIESFSGGIIAVISSKNIIIDNSFLTRLEKEKNSFSF